jgi:hypothetical protein
VACGSKLHGDVPTTFVDPRSDPDPGASRAPARFTTNAAELEEFHRFCLEGRLYDVERWIQAGGPIQLAAGSLIERPRSFRTALEIALERQDHSLVLLLVANGYDVNAEPEPPLDRALRLRRLDFLDLLLDWGADPRQVDLDALFATYESQLYERFFRLGVDFTSGHALAYALGHHTSNKPLFGFAKRHRLQDPKIQAELDIALAHHAWEGNEKGVMLCLWAGADPHAAVPTLRWGLRDEEDEEDEEDRYSAVYAACSGGHVAILERLKPAPLRDNYEELYRCACNEKTIELLARSKPPANPSRVVAIQLSRATWSFRQDRPVEVLQALFEAGVRWEASPIEEIADARRDLLKTHDWTFVRLMKLLATDDYCSRQVLAELARTPNMRKRMVKVGLIPPSPRQRSEFDRSSPARAGEALAKFGVELPKEKKAAVILPRVVQIGGWSRNGRYVHLDRPTLFERVWSMPVDKLAKEWGLPGRGLSKACSRLKIPVPSRGYWARVAAGQRVHHPKLPLLPPGQAEEILICVPEPVGVD